MNTFIPMFPDEQLYNAEITKYIRWEYAKYPHGLLFGSTGSGKTYALKIWLGRISKYIPDSELILCDYKSDADFVFADSFQNFYRFNDCMNGLKYALQTLQDRQQEITASRHLVILVFDEWASFVSNLPKKDADQAKSDLATLLMLGRSFNVQVIISQQRVDAVYFNSSRDNFSVVIGMGALSKESVNMMYTEYKDAINPNKSQGHGSMIMGNQLHEIIVPYVSDVNKLHSTILTAINRYSSDESH